MSGRPFILTQKLLHLISPIIYKVHEKLNSDGFKQIEPPYLPIYSYNRHMELEEGTDCA